MMRWIRLVGICQLVGWAWAAFACLAHAEDLAQCGTENLLAGRAPLQQRAMRGDSAALTDSAVAPEGTPWDGPGTISFESRAGSVTYDLGRPYPLAALYLQGDANDTYVLSGSLEPGGDSFRPIAEFANVVQRGHGLRDRALEVLPVTVRYVRIGDSEGDGFFSLSELAVYCRRPAPFPPAMRAIVRPAPPIASASDLPPAYEGIKLGWIDGVLGLTVVGLTVAWGRARRRENGSDPAMAAAPEYESRTERYFPIVVLLFVLSGCAALIYEIVWFQLLQLVLGSSAVSIGVLLGTFMGGMCIGSLALGRVVSARRHPLRVYALLELAIAVCAIAILSVIPIIQRVYMSFAGRGVNALLLRGLLAAVCLLPPTVLMGATLPAVARWVKTTPRGVSWLGYFYGANTLGAVVGCVLAGFYLLRVYDMPFASYTAIALNVAVALAALGLARLEPEVRPELSSARPAAGGSEHPAPARGLALFVYVAIGLSGATALSAEVIWTRLFTLLLSGSTYTFSIILAVFLVGIGLGSAGGSVLARRSPVPGRWLALAQLALIAGISWTAWNITRSLPFWPVNPLVAQSPWYQFQIDLVRCLWAILPPAFLWGASFPLALASLADAKDDAGVVVGRIYAANTIGAIAGAVATSLILIAWLGTQQSQRILIGLAALSALCMFAFDWRRRERASALPLGAAVGAIVALELALIAIRGLPPVPIELVGRGRISGIGNDAGSQYLYVGEGMNSSLAISRNPNGVLSYHNAGKVQASSLPQDMRLQRMLGHLTTLLPERPRSVLVIACGAGVTAGAASIDPRVERLTIAEIEPLVPKVASKYFGEHNFNVVRNPKVRVEVDDARHFLMTTTEKFDAITSDPFDPWVKGAASLYTREFWELAKQHLEPGGVVTVFVQLYESGMEAVKSEVATFFEAFPDGIVWGNTVRGEGYDIVLSGRLGPAKVDADSIDRLLTSPEFAQVAGSLRQIGFDSALGLLSTYGGRAAELKPWLRDAQINRDRNLRLQFLAGLGMNHDQRAEIYRSMLAYRRYPEDLFVGEPARLDELRRAILARAY